MANSMIRDPIHSFIHITEDERRVINSRPFQRLRHIHQLAMSSYVYPGACHKRFEHSLGVMELAGRVFDVVVNNIVDAGRSIIPDITTLTKEIWRQTVRMAALFHDVGHLPFSHAGEKLLPKNWSHERLTVEVIMSEEMRPLWEAMHVQPTEVAKLAVGSAKSLEYLNSELNPIQAILSEIITGDAFGVDRIDYLLRDSYHTGVLYGRFEHLRLIDSLRILPKQQGSRQPVLGLTIDGLHTAEGLALARYFMYSQVYFHPVRKAYDLHLGDFLSLWLAEGEFRTDLESHYKLTDNEVFAAIRSASANSDHPAHDPAVILERRMHYRCIYQLNTPDEGLCEKAGEKIRDALKLQFGDDKVMHMPKKRLRNGNVRFPVLLSKDEVAQSIDLSAVLRGLAESSVEYVYVHPSLEDHAREWLSLSEKRRIITS